MKNGVKMLDIAEKLGVSVVTVSNALAGREGVSDRMRRKICAAAEEMGYRPSGAKAAKQSSERTRSGKTIGILASERFVGARGTFYWELTTNISKRLSQLGMCTAYECITSDNEEKAILPNMITDNKADGIFVIGQVHRPYIEMLSRISQPLVFVDFYDGRYNVDSVNSDSINGGYLLTDHLISKGHRNIGFFGTFNATSSINDRFLGYIKCLMENNIRYNPAWTFDDRDEKGVLYTKIDFPEDMPTAFVCNCDETAFRVISALKSKGVRVPEDISVVGYDNYTVSNICIPPITTIEVDLEKMAEISVELMCKKLDDPTYTEGRRIITGRLIEKRSVLDINTHRTGGRRTV